MACVNDTEENCFGKTFCVVKRFVVDEFREWFFLLIVVNQSEWFLFQKLTHTSRFSWVNNRKVVIVFLCCFDTAIANKVSETGRSNDKWIFWVQFCVQRWLLIRKKPRQVFSSSKKEKKPIEKIGTLKVIVLRIFFKFHKRASFTTVLRI